MRVEGGLYDIANCCQIHRLSENRHWRGKALKILERTHGTTSKMERKEMQSTTWRAWPSQKGGPSLER